MMYPINPQAEALNTLIREAAPAVHDLLSERGKGFFFPKLGIVSQSADAKGARINATIGIALEEDGSPVRLAAIADNIRLDPAEVFPYAPSYGRAELRKAWRELIYSKNPSLEGTISLPVVTNALTHGLSVAAMLFVDPGDPILVTDKFWGNYRLIFEQAFGAKLVTFNTFAGNGFDVGSLDRALSERSGKQILLLNFPNNPAGYTPTLAEAEAIMQAIGDSAGRGNRIAVLLDDAYFGLVYEDGIETESLFSRLAGLHENVLAVKLDGATKEDYVWGLRVGFITFASKGITPEVCAALEEKAGGIVRGTISNDSLLSQSLILHAIGSPIYDREKREKYELLKSRYDKVREVLTENGGRYAEYFEPLPFNSGYFMCLALKKGLQGEPVRQILLK
ncbi:MAG TPA: aminotransferase class I/II-fold pyridoxal phosphate-dependent enzyme, partial [bacterium]|nr:aminotransferase class I/II-fold pyridoxal phosphate-dependent enzyme [bacterium]